jgi:hypothetical protein
MGPNEVNNNGQVPEVPETTPVNPVSPPTLFTSTPIVAPPKKSRKKLILLIALAVLLLAGAGTAAYFLFFQPKQQTSEETVAPSLPAETEPEVPADTTDYAKILIDKIHVEQEKVLAVNPGSTIVHVEQPYAPAYKYKDAAYYVTGAFGYSIYTTTTASTTSNPSEDPFIVAIQNATTGSLEKDTTLKKAVTEYATLYTSDKAICSVSKDSYPVSVSCANVRDYKNTYETSVPYAKAYFDAEGTQYQSDTVFGTIALEKKNDGYGNASVSIGPFEGVGGFAGLYFIKDDVVTFWQGTQSLINCSDFNTYALQKSFETESCYDPATASGEGTVKVTLAAQ